MLTMWFLVLNFDYCKDADVKMFMFIQIYVNLLNFLIAGSFTYDVQHIKKKNICNF